MNGSHNSGQSGFGGQFRNGLLLIEQGAKDLFYACVMAPYYWTWVRNERMKRKIRLGAFIALLLFAGLLIIEFSAEYLGAERLAHLLKLSSMAEGTKLAIFLAAATFIVFHYHSEIKKPEYEFKFVISLLTLMSKREAADLDSLQLFHALFSKAGILNVSAYIHQDEQLKIHSNYPRQEGSKFLPELSITDSVAGSALADGAARYAPRLFLPNRWLGSTWCLYMPHALRFKFDATTGADGASFYQLNGPPKVDRGVFSGDRNNISFCSLLSVPIKLGKDGCIGVLNFEFQPPGTLDAVDVVMASVYADWFGREVLKNERVTPFVPSGE